MKLENQYIPCLAEKPKQLPAKVADIKNTNGSAKATTVQRKRPVTNYRCYETCERARGVVEEDLVYGEAKC